MAKLPAPPHLRLVTNRNPKRSGAVAPVKEKQLSFPYPESTSVFLVYVDSIGKNEFAKIVGEYTPRWIIDVRAVPRLDTIAASRMSAFSLFEKAKISYIDLFGRLGIKSYRVAEANPALWSGAVLKMLRDSDRKGPYLFLFDNEHLLRIADDVLPEAMQAAVGKAARFAHIRHTDRMHHQSKD